MTREGSWECGNHPSGVILRKRREETSRTWPHGQGQNEKGYWIYLLAATALVKTIWILSRGQITAYKRPRRSWVLKKDPTINTYWALTFVRHCAKTLYEWQHLPLQLPYAITLFKMPNKARELCYMSSPGSHSWEVAEMCKASTLRGPVSAHPHLTYCLKRQWQQLAFMEGFRCRASLNSHILPVQQIPLVFCLFYTFGDWGFKAHR